MSSSSSSSPSSDLRFYDLGNAASGSWYVIHLLAANGEVSALKSVLKTFSLRFVCPKCRFHIRSHLKSNPLDEKRPFEWTVAFHNAVNLRLGKATLTDDERNDLFLELTQKADDDEKNVLAGGDCEGCGKVGAKPQDDADAHPFSIKETVEKTKITRKPSPGAKIFQTERWPIINNSYIS